MPNHKKNVTTSAFIVQYLGSSGLLKWMPDKMYLKLLYRTSMGVKLNLDNPQRYTEKLQWIKLYDRRDDYTMMADKYAVRKYVADTIGEEYLIPLLGVWDRPEDIDFSSLPEQFVMKCNHDSGGIIMCKDKAKLDVEKTRKYLAERLKLNSILTKNSKEFMNLFNPLVLSK